MRVHAVVCGAGRGGAGAGGVRGEGLCLVCHVRRRIHESACGGSVTAAQSGALC